MNENKLCIVASSNVDKVAEIRDILRDFPFKVLSAAEAGPELEVVEDASTFAGNATLKAKAYHTQYPSAYILADDSGLSVDGLDGMPGIFSARYGDTSDYAIKSQLIWTSLRDRGISEDQWSARFTCAIAWWEPEDTVPVIFEGRFDGLIVPYSRGEHGFGYDPIFFLPEYGMTSAEIDPELKNAISHRGKALAQLVGYLQERRLKSPPCLD